MRPKSILLITTADTDILTAERALPGLPDGAPPVVAVNPTSLPPGDGGEIMALAADAGAVALRLLGGKRAMPAAFDALTRHCRSSGIPLIACPGHQEWDEDLVAACTVAVAEVETVFAYLMQGGVPNFQNLFLFLSDTYFGTDYGHEAPAPLPWEGIYHPDLPDGMDVDAYIAARFRPGRPSIGLLFYRAHWMSGNLLPVDALIRSLESHGANVLPVFAFSLKHSPEFRRPGRQPRLHQVSRRPRRPAPGPLHHQHYGNVDGPTVCRRPIHRRRLVRGLPGQPQCAGDPGHCRHRPTKAMAGKRSRAGPY